MSELDSPGVDALFDQMRAMVKCWVKNCVDRFLISIPPFINFTM